MPYRFPNRLARLVLAWLLLWVAAASAAPWLGGSGGAWVCAGGSLKWVDGLREAGTGGGPTLECPACLGLDAPPPRGGPALPNPAPQVARLAATAADAAVSRRTAAPLPARGPPARVTFA